MKQSWHKDDLVRFKPKHDALIAIDSDGCVFDSMTIKQRIFHTGIIRFWGLQSAEKEFRRVAEWTALYSPWRGLNRFELLLRILQNLKYEYASLPAVRSLPDPAALAAFVQSGVALSADELAARVAADGDPELRRALDWSRAVSRDIAAVPEMPVFPEAADTLRQLAAAADLLVVSQTAEEALVREWRQAGLARHVQVIAGAELGSKVESLTAAMKGRYAPQRTLMTGDAPGDLETARSAGCLFFPVIPGREAASWIELRTEGLPRLLSGTFDAAYQTNLIRRFETALSPVPPWRAADRKELQNE